MLPVRQPRAFPRCVLLGVPAFTLALSLSVSFLLPGCGVPAPASTAGVAMLADGAAEITLQGDWNDVEAAVAHGVTVAEAAVLYAHTPSPSPPDDRERTYDLRTILAGAGTLRISRGEGGVDDGENIPITVRCEVRDAEDRARAVRIVAEVAARLRTLRGVEFAPTK